MSNYILISVLIVYCKQQQKETAYDINMIWPKTYKFIVHLKFTDE